MSSGREDRKDVRAVSHEHVMEDHRDCMRLLAEVEACLDSSPDREGRWVAALREKLPRLAERLRDHFRGEEGEYLYRELPAAQPQLAPRLERLCGEHRTMLEAIGGVIERAERLDGSRIHECRELNGRVQLLVATIRRHEAEENEILLSAYWDETGSGD